MKNLTILIVVIICVFLMTTLFAKTTIMGVQPDILLVCMVTILMLDNSTFVLPVVGFSMLGVDLLFARAIGFYTIPYIIAGIAVYLLTKKLNKKNFLVVLILTISGWVIKELSGCILSVFLGYSFSISTRVMGIILPGMAVSAVLCAILYPLLYVLFGRRYMIKDANYDLNSV